MIKPATVRETIAGLDTDLSVIVDAVEAGDDATAAAADLVAALDALAAQFADLGDTLDDDAWHDVADDMRALFNRIADLAGQARDDADIIAASDQAAGEPQFTRHKKRLDPAPVILDAFYGGMYYAGKGAWWTLKTTVKLSVAAGRLAAPHIGRAIVAAGEATAAGVVRVVGYVRGDGTRVDSYERSAPDKDHAAMRHVEQKTLRFKVTSIGEDGTFEGYGSMFGVLDQGGDIVQRGAFAESLRERKASGDWPKLLREHIPINVMGVWVDIAEDDAGLRAKGRLLTDVALGRETLALLRAGALDGLSIGYETIASRYETIEPGKSYPWYGSGLYAGEQRQARVLEKLDLWEISVVTFPMCRPAKIDMVKSAAAVDIAPLAAALQRRSAALNALVGA